jgi:putative transposase
MEEDIIKVAGPKGKHDPNREAYRHGYEPSSVKINGVNSRVTRPRARTLNGREVEIESFELARTKSCCAK